jgi:hypothetical protein
MTNSNFVCIHCLTSQIRNFDVMAFAHIDYRKSDLCNYDSKLYIYSMKQNVYLCL